MLVEPKLAGRAACVLIASALLFSACSSKNPRDINYGTDAGADFVPPDASDNSSDSSSGTIDGALDTEGSSDGGDQVDFSLDTNS